MQTKKEEDQSMKDKWKISRIWHVENKNLIAYLIEITTPSSEITKNYENSSVLEKDHLYLDNSWEVINFFKGGRKRALYKHRVKQDRHWGALRAVS